MYVYTWEKKSFNILSFVLPRFFYIFFCQISFSLKEINSNWFGKNWQRFLKHFQSVTTFRAFSCIYRGLKQYPSNISKITFLNASLCTLAHWSFHDHSYSFLVSVQLIIRTSLISPSLFRAVLFCFPSLNVRLTCLPSLPIMWLADSCCHQTLFVSLVRDMLPEFSACIFTKEAIVYWESWDLSYETCRDFHLRH